MLAGDAGIGKTSLAEETTRLAHDRGFRVLWGSCWEGDGAPAYWPWVQIVREYARGRSPTELLTDMGDGAATLAHMAPEIATRFLALPPPEEDADPERARFRLFDSVATLIRNASVIAPIVLVLDDLHWADRASLSLLRFLAGASHGAQILLIGTYRDTELAKDHPLRDVLGDLSADRLTLTGLTQDDVARLIRLTTGTAPQDDVVGAVAGRTTGNPLFVKEVSRLLEAQGRLDDAGAAVRLAIPEGVRDVLGRRIARLSGECAEVLTVASVLGTEFRLEVVESVLKVDRDRCLAAIDEAKTARVITEDSETPTRYFFAHALFREVLYDGLSTSRRAMLHHAAGEALEKAYASAIDTHLAELANHFIRAVPAADPAKAAEFSFRAGARAIAMYAYDEAAEHFRRVIDVLAPAKEHAPERIHAMLNLADALTRNGDLPLARSTYESVAVLARETGNTEAIAHAALGLGAGLGGFEVRLFDHAQIGLLREALDALPRDDSALRAWVLARLSVAQSFVSSIEHRTGLAREAVEMARRTGDPTALAYSLSSLCDAIAGPDHVQERIDNANEMLRLAEEMRGAGSCGVPSCEICLCDPEMSLLARRFLLVAHLERGQLREADAQLDAYSGIADHLRQPLSLWYVPLWQGMRANVDGRWSDAVRFLEEVREVGEHAHSDNAKLLWLSQRAEFLRLRDEVATFPQLFGDLLSRMPDFASTPQGKLSIAYAHSISGDLEAARAVLDEPTLLDDFVPDSEFLSTMAAATMTARALGDRTIAAKVYQLLLPYQHLFVVDGIGGGMLGSVQHFLALNAATLGRPSDAHFEAAIAAHDTVPAPVLAAITRREYARALLKQKHDAKAKTLVEEAARGYERVDLAKSAATVRSMMTTLEATFRNEGDLWAICWGGEETRIKNAKGLRDIATLLASPGKDVHSLDLIVDAARASASTEGLTKGEADAGPILDDRARAEYKRRLTELEDERREAEEINDTERAARANEAIQFIAAELAAAYGLGGRPRKSADPVERARKAVTERIRDSLSRIERALPELGSHLKRSIRTGAYCSYMPDEPVAWTL